MFKELSAPLTVQWEVTPWCNHRCIHCYNYWRKNPVPKEVVDEEKFQLVVSQIFENKVLEVIITGGEPLGIGEHLLPFMSDLSSSGVRLLMNSNLTLLTHQLARQMKTVGISTILTSVPSANPDTCDKITGSQGSLSRIIKGIEIALANGIRPVVNMVVTKINLSDIYITAKTVSRLGVRAFAATRAANPGNCSDFGPYSLTLNEFRQMLRELVRVKEELGLHIDSLEFYPPCSFDDDSLRQLFRGRMCTAGKTSCTIGFDGSVRPCSRAQLVYGYVSEGLKNAWKAMHPWRTNEWLPTECNECTLRERCGGGCKVDALNAKGSFSKPDPCCDFTQLPIKVKRMQFNEELPPISAVFCFNKDLRTREEEFGGILWISSRQWVAVNKKLYTLALRKKGGGVSLKEFSECLEVSEGEVLKTVGYLYSKGILKEEEKNVSRDCFFN